MAKQEREMGETPKRVIRDGVLIAGPMKLACYRVLDPETEEYSPRQFHMTYDNTVMAVMGEESAKLFATFVGQQMDIEESSAKPKAEPPVTSETPNG